MNHVPYIEMPFKDALELKYARGKQKHRQAGNELEFHGNPLDELFCEMLDGIHYCDEAAKLGFNLEHRKRQFLSTALELQGMWRERNKFCQKTT